nr:M20 family metallopeptidase [Clostridium muellerianum]
MDEVIKLRKELSENAELSFKEYKTCNIVKEFLENLNIDTKALFNTGVVGNLNEGEEAIGIRADMDALPVNGVSHVCGHDYHMAIVLGCALILKKMGYERCVKFIFQPGEEETGGALPMIHEGVLKNPEVKYIIGFHVWPNVEVGKLEVTSGPSMASVDDFFITFHGKGGHAAMPHLCNNPLYPALDFIQTMNTKMHLENNPLDPFVLTFSSINAGSAPNVIADNVKISGTVRTFNKDIRENIKTHMKSLSKHCGDKYNCNVDIKYHDGYPPLINDKGLTDKFIKIAKDSLGENNVLPLEKSFAAEDFSYFAEKVPSVHFRLGICNGKEGNKPLHASNFDADDKALYYGIYSIVQFILSL